MITIRDIHKRLKLLPETSFIGNKYVSFIERAGNAIASENPYRIMKTIEYGVNDTTNSITLETMLDLYDALYEYGNEHNVEVYGRMIAEEYVAKVRDAKDAQTNLRRKLGRIKTAATTKASSNVEEIQDAIKNAISKLKQNLNTNISTVKSNIDKGLPKKKSKPSKVKNEAFIHGYESMLESSTKMIYCDRILDNYNRISKRFNIDRIIQENIMQNGIDDTIVSICRLVETYDVPDKVKYNTVLETVWYGFNKNYVDCSPDRYVTLITDYFMAKGNNRDMCGKLLEASMVVKKDDYQGDLEVITEEEPEDENETAPKFEAMNVQDQIRAHVVGYYGNPSIKLNEGVSFNKIFNDFKKSDENKKETRLQWLMRKLYTKNADDIVDGTPSVLNYIRLVFVLGTCAIHPVLLAITAIADIFVSLHMQRKETEEMLKCFKNEIDISKKKLKTTKDTDEQTRLKQYIKTLEKGYEKIDEYYEEKLTDAEIDKKYDEQSDDSFDDITGGDDSGDDFGDLGDFDDADFDDMDFNESYIVVIGSLAERAESIALKEVTRDMLEEIVGTDPRVCSELADIALYYPNIIDPAMLESVIDEAAHNGKNTITTNSSLYDALSKLKYSTIKPVKEPETLKEYASQMNDTINILEALNSILQSCYYYHPLIEGSFTNSIKLASDKVKRTLTKLSDKDKQISKSIDVAANNAKKAMEKSLTTDNREQVIKGSILPSASKAIKLAIAGTGLFLIDPVIALIGALGYLGVSKSYKAKERQMIIDEIEIELKMCEKYIEIAESKNDMKALKRLLTIQRELERQRQRIKYNMKVKFGQKYFDSSNKPADTSLDND